MNGYRLPLDGGVFIPPTSGTREERDAARRTVIRQARRLAAGDLDVARTVLAALGLDQQETA